MENFRINEMTVAIDLVHPNTWNPKDAIEDNKDNEERFQTIKRGVQEHGFMMAVTVREAQDGTYEIIDGFHRWRACKELGYERIKINNLGQVDDARAKALTLVFEKAKVETNPTKEAELLQSIYELIPDYGEMSKILPYDAETIENKIELIQHDWDQYNQEGEENVDQTGDAKFTFRISPEAAEICNKAISLAGDDKDAAFIEICRSYVELGGGEVN